MFGNIKVVKKVPCASHYIIFQVGTSQGSVCTLADSALTKKSSIMVCDTFKVNILLVSPDKKWITAGTKDNDDSSLKVFLVVFDCLIFIVFPALVWLPYYLCPNDTVRKIAIHR